MLYIFGKTYQAFLARITNTIKVIMREEMNLVVHHNRFEFGHLLIPFRVVLFESEKELGFYNPTSYQIALNKKLVHLAHDEVIKNIIRHELAHMISHLIYPHALPHGEEFKNTCRKYHWGEEVSAAYASLDYLNDQIEGGLESEKLLLKVKKLFALSSSDNSHEAKLALTRANKLLFDHQLEFINQNEEFAYLKKVIKQKRLDGKLKAIYEMMKLFYVEPVFSYGKGEVALEIIGEKSAVEFADYVANFLFHAFDLEWKKAKKENPKLSGKLAKNVFFRGLSIGYKEQIESSRTSEETLGRALIARSLVSKVKLAYQNLSSRSTHENNHLSADLAGRSAGKKFKIHPALESSGKAIKQLTS